MGDETKRDASSLRTGSAQLRSGLYHDRAPFTKDDISPLCGSEMKYSSAAFIIQVKTHPCDGTTREERERGCVVCSDNLYLAKGSFLTLLHLFELKEI